MIAREKIYGLFPYYHIGGAEKVHARILAAVASRRPAVIFTHESSDDGYLADFRASARVFHARRLLDSPRLGGFCRALFTRYVNHFEKATVLGGNCPLFYDLLPGFAEHVRCVDVIHGLGGNLELRSLPHVERLDCRVVVADAVKEGLLSLYRKHNLSPELGRRIEVIENHAEFPTKPLAKNFSGPLRVLYVGRGTPEKRVHLIGRLASACQARGLHVEFTLVGAVAGALDAADQAACHLAGVIVGFSTLSEFYERAHVLVLASAREGLPLALLDAMAFGLVPIATAVGGIPKHVIEGESGFLIDSGLNEEGLVNYMLERLTLLDANRELLARMSATVTVYASGNFGRERFVSAWCQALSSAGPMGKSCMSEKDAD